MGEPFKSWLYFYYIQHSMVSYPDTLIVAYVLLHLFQVKMNDSIQLYENELSLVTKPIPKLFELHIQVFVELIFISLQVNFHLQLKH